MRSRSASSCATSISRSSMLLRRTSVGCAVSTGLTRIVLEQRLQLARETPAARSERARRGSCPCGAVEPLGRARDAADVVLVLGDVGEMREIAEGAHHLDRALAREAVEGRLRVRGARRRRRRGGTRSRSGGCARRSRIRPRPAAGAPCRRGRGRPAGCPRAAPVRDPEGRLCSSRCVPLLRRRSRPSGSRSGRQPPGEPDTCRCRSLGWLQEARLIGGGANARIQQCLFFGRQQIAIKRGILAGRFGPGDVRPHAVRLQAPPLVARSRP